MPDSMAQDGARSLDRGQRDRARGAGTAARREICHAANAKGPVSWESGPWEGQRCSVGWLMGLEPTTTRITIWDSTN